MIIRKPFRQTIRVARTTQQLDERALEAGLSLVDDLGPYDAFSDILVLSEHFDVLDEQYPGSKLILSTRDLDEWVDSRRRHVERNVERQARGEYHGTFLRVEPDAWIAEYRTHHARVAAYFADRPDDLLTIDISASDGCARSSAARSPTHRSPGATATPTWIPSYS